MNQFIELLISGLSLGCIYALIAMGFVVVFKATNVVNFAHASVLMLGAYLVARWHGSLGFFGAVAAAAACCAVVAALCDIVLVRALRRRRGTQEVLAILTIGINIVLGTELAREVGTDLLPSGAPWGSDVTHLLGVTVPQTRIAAAVVALVLMGLFWVAFTRSDWGVAMRSAASDPEAAALSGIRLGRVAAGAWALAGALAAIGGAFFTSFPAAGVNNSTGLLALTAIPAAVLGGLDSTAGAVVGGLTIGVATTLAAGYQDQIAFLGRGLSEVVPYIALLLVLLWRPSGVFGTREVTRV
ncbi:MAG: branched-chain amino acid transport system permease protein [Thermoleophilaceae bacterium]|jgi:branched-chain amino acid transport system permease protein|nr:branched-chain amino acid transport system permease protein [Thermoleophilaceae bacterium]MEA2401374.1 branched-chain amino acid transport system permease protein [Thermoleophilaceae bacterium]MEA2454516.1 branched-chain amino acid transport system permease protein [Thermoleophilaceae bacterium]